LPNRRPHLVLEFEHGGFAYTAGRRALTRNGDGTASGPLAHTLDLLDQQGPAK
jgi:hypothetical protein